MKTLIFGSNGMLGAYLTSYLKTKHTVIAITRKDIDLSLANKAEILMFLKENVKMGDLIINACGVIKQRSYNSIDMINVNSLFPQILAEFKDYINCNVIHITTDCVFSGNKGLYNEIDKHDCLDDYGKSKSLGENLNITNIRTSIIGEEKLNKKSLLEWVISNKNGTIDGYENHLWNGVTCLELAKLIDKIINEKLFWNGVKHVHSPNTVSKYELVTMINKIYNLGLTINKKNTETHCYRNLSSIFPNFINQDLYTQILEQKNYVNN
jgi:dTDP-4-dehydrorhamnose reductase